MELTNVRLSHYLGDLGISTIEDAEGEVGIDTASALTFLQYVLAMRSSPKRSLQTREAAGNLTQIAHELLQEQYTELPAVVHARNDDIALTIHLDRAVIHGEIIGGRFAGSLIHWLPPTHLSSAIKEYSDSGTRSILTSFRQLQYATSGL